MLPTRPREAARSTCSSCTTPAVRTATRVSCGVMLIRTSSIAGSLRGNSSATGLKGGGTVERRAGRLQHRYAGLAQQLRGLVERQSHHARVAAVDPLDEHAGQALDRITAGF